MQFLVEQCIRIVMKSKPHIPYVDILLVSIPLIKNCGQLEDEFTTSYLSAVELDNNQRGNAPLTYASVILS